jgi:2-oxoglutarate ferredoxin oxidoreductase subunit gamma
MTERIIVAGSGGQGIMLLGKVLAEAAILQGSQVTYLPAYGAEVRGGTSHCIVTISEQEISSPYTKKADTLIVLNNPSLEKFRNRVKDSGLLIFNSSLTKIDTQVKIKILQFPFTDIAVKLGNIKVANMVALGCYVTAKQIIEPKNVLRVFKLMAPAGNLRILEINEKALAEGIRLAHGQSKICA